MRKHLAKLVTLAMVVSLFAGMSLATPAAQAASGDIVIYLDQERQEFDGAILSGAFRQADHLLNGFAASPAKQKEVLDLVFGSHLDPGADPAAKGIGISIWRNMIGDGDTIGYYRWSTYGRWWDGPAPTFKTGETGTSTIDPATGKSNFDGSNYRWWFDAEHFADSIPNSPSTQSDSLWDTREGGTNGDSFFDVFNNDGQNLPWMWPAQPANAGAVALRSGRSPTDRGQVWAMKWSQKYAYERGEEMKFMSAAWSPPKRMKSGNVTYGGTCTTTQYQNFATYLADYVEGFEKIYGIPIYGLSPSNEPNANNTAYSDCDWGYGNTGTYYNFVNGYLYPTMKSRGLLDDDHRIHLGDEMNYNTRYWTPFWQSSSAQANSNSFTDYVFHSYSASTTGGSIVSDDSFREAKLRANMNGSKIMESEISTMASQSMTVWNYSGSATGGTATRTQSGSQSRSDMGSAIGWAQKWIRQLGILEINAIGEWWAWGIKRPESTWPANGVGTTTSPGDNSLEDLIYIVNNCNGQNGSVGGGISTSFDYRVHKVFWAMGHFSKFIRPGWHRVNNTETYLNESTNTNYLNEMTTAYKSPEPDANGYYDIAIVVINGMRVANTVNIQFPGYEVTSLTPWRTTEDAAFNSNDRLTGTTAGNNMLKLADITNLAAVDIPAVSMTTFVGKAKPIDSYAVNASSTIAGHRYNRLEGSAIFNNDQNLNNPRLEIYQTPSTTGTGLTGAADATIYYDNLDFGAGQTRLNLSIGGGVSGTATFNVEVRVDGQLVTTNATAQSATSSTTRTINLNQVVSGVHDVSIRFYGATGRTVLTSLQFGEINNVNRQVLKDALDAWADILDTEDPADYTTASWGAAVAAAAAGQLVYDDLGANQTNINEAAAAIIAAIAALETPYDYYKRLLKEALDDLNDFMWTSPGTRDNYTPETWEVADDILSDGWDVYNDTGSTIQDFIDWTVIVSGAAEDLEAIVSVTDITGIPATAFVGALTLNGVVVPTGATYQTIVWEVVDPDTTGATISGDTLTTTAPGTVKVKATIADGVKLGSDFVKEFDIVISYNAGSDLTLSAPDVLMIKKGAYAYVSVFTDATASIIKTSLSTTSFIDVAEVGGPTVQCITAKKAGTTVLTFYADTTGGASKTIVVIVN